MVSTIPKWDCTLDCCSYFPRTNAPYLEESEQLDLILEGNYVAIDADDSSCHGYYIIKFYSSPYIPFNQT